MENQVEIRRLTSGSLFKLLLIGWSTILIPFTVLMGILSVFGFNTVKFDGSQKTGITGLLTSIIMAPVLAIFFTTFSWVGSSLGLLIYSKFKTIVIKYIEK